MRQGFTINRSVNHERLDDEVIAIDLQTGVYFALDDAAADCWSVAASGGGVEAMVAFIAHRYGVAAEAITPDIEAFVAQLLEAGLLVPADAGQAPDLSFGPSLRPYAPPILARYDDLDTLLLIDPIHEVDEAGWPVQLSDLDGV